MSKSIRLCCAVVVLLSLFVFSACSIYRSQPLVAKDTQLDKRAIIAKTATLQIPFIENRGQLPKEVMYYANTFAGTVYITNDGEIGYGLIKREGKYEGNVKSVYLKEKLIHAKSSKPVGEDKALTKVNYFRGRDKDKWQTNLSTYNEINLGEVYDGVELKLKAYGNNVEKLFTVKPSGKVSDIKMSFEGAKGVKVIDTGELELSTEYGDIKFTKPVAYQEIGGKRIDVRCEFVIEKDVVESSPMDHGDPIIYGFRIASYNKDYPIIIDPQLSYSTYLGGSDGDYGYGIAVDSEGNVYVTGETYSFDFPTASPIQGSLAAGTDDYDAFVTKINASGTALVYSTYLGGNDEDHGYGIAVDSEGNAYVTGYTWSYDFPTASPIQKNWGGQSDAFVTKINASGTALVYSTYLGGGSEDNGYGIAVDSEGNAYVTGYTLSSNFPTASPIQKNWAGGEDAFVTKINASGTDIVYSTYLGGNEEDKGYGIAVDSKDNAYVTGNTWSSDFPTASPIQKSLGGEGEDAFVTKINASGTALVYSTYLGGAIHRDYGRGIAVDSEGNAYVTGYTFSSDFPTASPIQEDSAGGIDAFVTKINASGTALVYSTYLGGNGWDRGYGIAVDSEGNAYVTGNTSSSDFPTASPIQQSLAGGTHFEADAFVTKINASGTALVYSTYLGGSDDEYGGYGIAVDGEGNAFATGYTWSSDFPTTSSIQESFAGGTDVFVAMIGTCTYGLSDDGASFDSTGGTGNLTVTTSEGCDWTAASNDSWITITSATSGSGNGVITYTVAPNTSANTITGTITIEDKTFTVTVSAAPLLKKSPDLIVKKIKCPRKIKKKKATIKAVIKNIGKKKASSSTAKFYLSSNNDSSITDGDIVVGVTRVKGLKKKQSRVVKYRWKVNEDPGKYYIKVQCDSKNVVAESNEENNIKASKKVTVK
ncbi:MAG: hypothetical protein D6734_05710 [Candidatus Schekmanbacteria bacterium]|nr:MAG: hypothetical protein D6734_05710 [Candidatus Schekmanbacteria bacterium]